MAGEKVYLYVTEDVVRRIGDNSGVGLEDFIQAVKVGPPWVTRRGLCQRAFQSYLGWRSRGLEWPPYIGYLSLFVMAAGIEGDFSPNAYYPKLRQLLGEEPQAGQPASFDRMLHLWDDLERWANEDKAEALGVFEIDFADKRFHVGLPIAQVVLDEEERKALHTIFAEAGLDPQSPPTDQELAAQVAVYGKDKLNRRTIRSLDEPSSDKQLSAVLTSVIRTELLDWNGVAASSEQQVEGEGRYFGTLKLCCQINRVAERAQFTFRCRATNPFPEGKLSLTLNGRTVGYCEEVVPTWSSVVTAGAGGRTVDASAFDWQSGLVLKNEQNSWSFKLPASSVRILVNGAGQGLPGLIEVRQLPEGQNFYLAVSDELGPLLEKWGNTSCVGFRRFEITDGLPDSWRLYYAEAVLRSGALAPTHLPMLTLPTNVRLRFSGGVRSSRGNHYYNFARPRLIIEGCDETAEVYCNEVRLTPDPTDGSYHLPEGDSDGSKFTIKVVSAGEEVKKTLYLEDDFVWPNRKPLQLFSAAGVTCRDNAENGPAVAGAILVNFDAPDFDFGRSIRASGEGATYLIGRGVGEIVAVHKEPFPTTWAPVWLVTKRHQRGVASFCGTSVDGLQPVVSRCTDKRRLRLWKEVVWHSRKIVKSPTDARLRALWKKYQEAARDA